MLSARWGWSDAIASREVGDRAREFEHAVKRPRREIQLLNGKLEKIRRTIGELELRVLAHLRGIIENLTSSGQSRMR